LWRIKKAPEPEETAEVGQFITIGKSGRVYAGFSNRKLGQSVYCLDAEGNKLWNASIPYLNSSPVELSTGEVIITSDKAQCFNKGGDVVWSVDGTFNEVGNLQNQDLVFLIGSDFGKLCKVTLDGKTVQTIDVGRFQNLRFNNDGTVHLHRDGKISVIDLICW
jgi:hypothetical protein